MAKRRSASDVADRAKDKAAQFGETITEQAGQVVETTRSKSADLAGQAKHKAQELADAARTAAARDDRAGGYDSQRKRGIGAAIATGSALLAALWIRRRRRRRARG